MAQAELYYFIRFELLYRNITHDLKSMLYYSHTSNQRAIRPGITDLVYNDLSFDAYLAVELTMQISVGKTCSQ